MAEIIVEESWDARQLEYDRWQRLQGAQLFYKVFGVAGELNALNALVSRAPMYFEKLRIAGFGAQSKIGANAYKIAVKYERRGADGWGTPEVRVTIASQQVTIQTALQRVAVSPGAPTHVTSGRAVNLSPRGEVLGVSVPRGYTERMETYYVPRRDITTQYEKNLNKIVGSVNLRPFRGYEAGEVRFDGADYAYKTTDEEIPITFRFSISPNEKKCKLGSWEIEKRGWDFGWVKFRDAEQNGVRVSIPEYAVVDQVLWANDFKILKIGG